MRRSPSPACEHRHTHGAGHPVPVRYLREPIARSLRTAAARMAADPRRGHGLALGHGHRTRTGMAGPIRVPVEGQARLRHVCVVRARHRRAAGRARFGTRLYTLCADHRGGIQVPDGRGRAPREWILGRCNPVSSRPTRSISSGRGRSLALRSVATVARPYFPSISVVPVAEAGDSGEQSGIDAFRSLLGWPRRRRPDYNE